LIIRDPIWGDIEFGEEEKKILDTREMQRLRGIKQLGTAYLVYPGAVHTRFDHSIGTMEVAKRIMDVLSERGHEISDESRLVVSCASLLHDVTHVPFGHTFEDERKILPRHDSGSRLDQFLGDGELGDALEDMGLHRPVRAVLSSKDPEIDHPQPWLVEIVNNSVSADLLDYLRRDSYFTGLRQDYDDRVLRYFTVAEVDVGRTTKIVLAVNLGKEHMIRHDARSEILHLLRMRYFLTERVYYHHAKQASGAMISKSLELAIRNGFDVHRLLWMDDWSLIRELSNPDSAGDASSRLATMVRYRRLYKRAFVLSSDDIDKLRRDQLISNYNRPSRVRSETEGEIVSRLNEMGFPAKEGDVIIHCPDLGAMKEARVFAVDEEGVVDRLNRHRRSISRGLDFVEDQYTAIWSFTVFCRPRLVAAVNEICKELFPSERVGYTPKTYVADY